MTSLNQTKTLDEFSQLINSLEIAGTDWTNDKLFQSNGKTFSMKQIIRKLNKIYKSELFHGARLSEEDTENIRKIKDRIIFLDSKKIDVTRAKKCCSSILAVIIKIINWIKSLFFCGEINKTTLLKELSIRAARPDETLLLPTTKSNLSENVRNALKSAYQKYYKNPFKDTKYRPREAMRIAEGKQIHRYNHGLTHSTRKVFFIPFIVDYFLRHSHDHLSKKIYDLIDRDGKDAFIEKLQIAAAFEVAGRESECGSRDDLQTYTNYLKKSKETFEQHCKEHDLIGPGKLFRDKDDLTCYANAIKEKYHNRFKKEKMDAITAIIDVAHTLDEFRCYWPSRMKNELEEINHYYTKHKNNRDLWGLAKFCQLAVRATGDRVMTEFAEGPLLRDLPFAHGDLWAIAIRNYRFTDEHAFSQCSHSVDYCWKLLKKVPPPISYSRGETTYSYLAAQPKSTMGTPAEFQNIQTLIKAGRAIIRLVNTKKDRIGFEMQMLNNPVFFRPTRPVKGERNFVLTDRIQKTVKERGFKNRRSLREQMESKSEEDTQLWGPVHEDRDRGLPKFTEYAKKVAFTLLRPDAQIHHFTGQFGVEYIGYQPIGFLYDVGEINQKKGKFIFPTDVGTSSKFWIGKEATEKISRKEGGNTQLSLPELQLALKTEAEKNLPPQKLPFYKGQHASNEQLFAPKKSAIKALFSTQDSAEARVRALLHAVYLAHDDGIRAPLLILDGRQQPKPYLKKELEADLLALSGKKIFNELFFCFFSKIEKINNKPQALYQACCHFLPDSVA